MVDKQYYEFSRQYHLKAAKEYMEKSRNATNDSDRQFYKSMAEDEIKMAKVADDKSKE